MLMHIFVGRRENATVTAYCFSMLNSKLVGLKQEEVDGCLLPQVHACGSVFQASYRARLLSNRPSDTPSLSWSPTQARVCELACVGVPAGEALAGAHSGCMRGLASALLGELLLPVGECAKWHFRERHGHLRTAGTRAHGGCIALQ